MRKLLVLAVMLLNVAGCSEVKDDGVEPDPAGNLI
jgi:hypothetical protein